MQGATRTQDFFHQGAVISIYAEISTQMSIAFKAIL
jgi:hypothetical protein